MVHRPGIDPPMQVQGQLAPQPSPGMGYMIGAQDNLSSLLQAAYGSQGNDYASAFMGYNAHIDKSAFSNLGAAQGGLLHFPSIEQLQQMNGQQSGFPALDALFSKAGLPAGAAAHYFQNSTNPVGDPTLASQLNSFLATGYLPPGTSLADLINTSFTQLKDEWIKANAKAALQEGRVQGQRSKVSNPSEKQIQTAMGQNHRPKVTVPNDQGVVPLNQGDYGGTRLGNGDASIAKKGCLVSALAMASTKITGDTSMNPATANEKMKQGGAFTGANLSVKDGARSLGMKVVDRRAVTSSSKDPTIAKMDHSLENGKPVVAGVDYKAGSSSAQSGADHFVTITSGNSKTGYGAIDPNGGGNLTFSKGSDGYFHATGSKGQAYRLAEATILDKA